MNIAIVGASANREKYGNKAVRAYKEDAQYSVFPINPKEDSIEGVKCFRSVKDVPSKIDIVSLYVPPAVSVGLVPEFADKKISVAYINPGAESEELVAALKSAGIEPRLICSIRAIGRHPDEFK